MDEKTTAGPLLRTREAPKQPAFIELFFDLVYVFALTQLTHLMIDNLTLEGGFEALVLFLALWWVWVLTAWMTDQFDPQRASVQWYVILVMFGILLMAIQVPKGFDGNGLFFAITFSAINLGRFLFCAGAARGTTLLRHVLRARFWSVISTLFWIPGAFVEGWARGGLWLAALAVDYVSALLRWPTPWRSRRALGPALELAATHLAERYRQVFLIALGEIVLIMGLTFTNTGYDAFTPRRTVVLALSFASAALMWRLYIYQAGSQLAPAIAVSGNPHRLSQWSAYAHMAMVAGILLTAVGFTLAIEHPFERTPTSWVAAITGGPALFLAGRSAFEYVIFGRATWPRLMGILGLAGLSVIAPHLLPEVTLAATTFVLIALVAYETARGHRRPPKKPAPSI
ncbi:low temperature requirement protein A [Micromonospora gifhornensis]|uniref:Membrane protein n=1 Tax=Micromonospora gifhornensis TaxID=84594 RepID=A0ABQ4IBI1_9ACTN|nr:MULTISPECIES: low temperature requirement protein A [Micromonospora]PMR60021.1 low temperature requirement protein A [Verrucosispora sp. ts21]GIJ15232.1 membrane protein [Micromonospora gifhornensis]